MKKQITIPFFIPHRGCPHQCIFCDQKAISGSAPVLQACDIIPTISRYISTISRNTRAEIAFFGGSFTGIDESEQNTMLSEAQKALTQGLIQGIRLSTRPDYINEEICIRLKSFGVSTVELGIQSFSDDVLKRAERGHTASDGINAHKLLKKHGFDTVIQLLPGLPGDTPEKSLASAETAKVLLPAAARIYPAIVLEGTALAKEYHEKRFHPLTLEEAVDISAKMTEILDSAGIPVIKTGLHPFSETQSAQIAAGPYHPSFGFLVKSRIRRNQLAQKAAEYVQLHNIEQNAFLTIPRLCAEEYIGSKRENISWLKNNFVFSSFDYCIREDCTCPTFSTAAKFPD